MTAFLEPVPLGFKVASSADRTVYSLVSDFDGHQLTVVYTVDEVERVRRERDGSGPCVDEKSLAAALSVPDDDLALVPARFTEIVRGTDGHHLVSAIEDPQGEVWATRLISPVVELLEISTAPSSWAQGSAVAHDWVGYGPRIVRIDANDPVDMPMVLVEASHYGMGVALAHCADRVLEPAPFVPHRWTSARWRFAELVYERHLEALNDGARP